MDRTVLDDADVKQLFRAGLDDFVLLVISLSPTLQHFMVMCKKHIFKQAKNIKALNPLFKKYQVIGDAYHLYKIRIDDLHNRAEFLMDTILH